jgi:hypothetical protein
LVLQAFLLWQGGFLFYSAVVVPIGTDVFDSAALQGLVTQRVTVWLNLFGGAWAAVYLWELIAGRGGRWRWLTWAVMAGLLPVLLALHGQMDPLISPETGGVTDRPEFRRLHIAYLWASTAQWVLGLGLAWLTVRAWSITDQSRVVSSQVPNPEPT